MQLSAKWLYVRVWYRMAMTHPSGWEFCRTRPFLYTIALAWILQRLKNSATSAAVLLWCREEGGVDLIALKCMSFIQIR